MYFRYIIYRNKGNAFPITPPTIPIVHVKQFSDLRKYQTYQNKNCTITSKFNHQRQWIHESMIIREGQLSCPLVSVESKCAIIEKKIIFVIKYLM